MRDNKIALIIFQLLTIHRVQLSRHRVHYVATDGDIFGHKRVIADKVDSLHYYNHYI